MFVQDGRFIIALWNGIGFLGTYALERVAFGGVFSVEGSQTTSRFEVHHLQRPLPVLVDQRQHQISATTEIHVDVLNHRWTVRFAFHRFTRRGRPLEALPMEERKFSSHRFNRPPVQGRPLHPLAEQSTVDERTQMHQSLTPRGLRRGGGLFSPKSEFVHDAPHGLSRGQIVVGFVQP